MGMVQWLFGEEHKDKDYKDISGFLTKEEIQRLKNISKRNPNPMRKRVYKTWICRRCEHPFFYNIIRCPLCESPSIMETEQPTLYELNGSNGHE